MKNLLPKFFSKYVFFLSLAFLIIIFLVSLINIFVCSVNDTIQATVSTYLGQAVSIESAHYLPINALILNNVSFAQEDTFVDASAFSIKKIKVLFSLREIILKRNLYITALYAKHLNVDCSKIKFAEIRLKEILDKIYYLAKDRKMHIGIKDAVFFVPKESGEIFLIRFDSSTDIQQEQVLYSRGRIGFQRCRDVSFCKKATYSIEPLDYYFSGQMKEGGLGIESLELQREGFYLKLWGEVERNTLVLDGITSMEETPDRAPSSSAKRIRSTLGRILSSRIKPHHQIIGKSTAALKIFDLHCQARILATGITIDEVNFSIHNIPFAMQGHISFVGTKGLQVKISSFPDQPSQKRMGNTKKLDIEITGTLRKEKFNGRLLVEYIKATKTKKTPQRVETVFKGLGLSVPGKGLMAMLFDEAQFYYRAGDNEYELPFSNGTVSFDFADKRFKTAKFSSGIHDGFLNGDGIIDISKIPFRSSFNLAINDVSANKLRSVSAYFLRVYGSFESVMNYRNYPDSALKGKFIVRDGYLDNLLFFRWLSGFFSIPALQKVNFSQLSSYFLVSDGIVALEDIDLDAQGVTLAGFFRLYENDLVASKLSLALLRGPLSTSPKFRSLLKLLGEDIASIDFDFQLSGLFNAMNFMWLETDFKRRLQDSIPGFIERGLERKIEDAIKSISDEGGIF